MAFEIVQTQKHYLAGSGISSSATSITLMSFKTPDGTNVTMTDFGDIGYGVIEPGTEREENISFEGITQNADGTATLTTVTRGLAFVNPFAETSALKLSHSGGSVFIISNSAPFLEEFKSYLEGLTIAGAGDAEDALQGLVERATTAEVTAGTATGSTGAPLFVAPDRLAASIYGTRLPSSDEKDALAGSSGAPSSSNTFITEADVSSSSAASKIPRLTAGGLISTDMLPTDDGSIETSDKTFLRIQLPWNADFWTWTTGTSGNTVVRHTSGTQLSVALNSDSGGTGYRSFDYDKELEVAGSLGATCYNQFGFLSYSTPAASATITDRHVGVITDAAGTVYGSVADGTTQTKTALSGVTANVQNVYQIKFVSGSSAKFYVNGTLKATITTNLPTGSSGSLRFIKDNTSTATATYWAPTAAFEII